MLTDTRCLLVRWKRLGFLVLGIGFLSACGGKTPSPAEARSGNGAGNGYATPFGPAPESAEPAAPDDATPRPPSSLPAAPSRESRAEDGKSGRADGPSSATSPRRMESSSERPGLATHWGETRSSSAQPTTFERADFSTPMATLVLWYNDRAGAQAMARTNDYRGIERMTTSTMASGVSFKLQDESGQPLPGYTAGGRSYVVGDAGSRYAIMVTNPTPARFEAVLSVDGLDVLDGRPANYGKRGYIIPPYGSIAVDGFRQSEATVAAFRFGSVRGSYAARKGDDRNVGVIGLAVFHERGYPRWPWNSAEIARRQRAEPFPNSQFATPPP